ncbi:beta-ketoacyl-ACP synthase II [Propionibacterium australiense]|uniref:3-oxoacyl-[acyl-carrier-protein] synthase 2 n=1 Tax=Propionibacterium australiense TaxID=119981 RepID=A0A383S526_9ACTN|nr:beta-ketoacyl-ACP synthase II [Propionibacterium australiense]RLP11733.1 beta-ketoacyl-[acyl-carrier-protein] synthase II [Propionibacterium australiense]SYZ32479.1 3-oxoacyl-[acyl-carrier-protein] synthase 2 [Propionibacterium australiense]VEH90129.1 3-oxoacyl-[acyl-carrier-protein] synthase 2 [Propionibacterium australiense]
MSTIVVTGLGALTPLGNDVASTWEGLRNGRSGISTIEQEWAADLPVRFAGQVDVDVDSLLPRVEVRHLDRSSQLAVIAARQAWEDAGLTFSPENETDPDRLAAVVGTGIGGLQSTISQWEVMRTKSSRRVSPFTVPMLMSNAPAANVGLRIGARAGVHTTVSACASSNEAISLALDMLRAGRADIALTGGTEAVIHPLTIVSFAQMQALSKRNDEPQRASRPWDGGRDGFVMGEGAVMLVLETLDHALERGATIYGTLAGSGISADSYDMVKPDPSGQGQSAAMRKALADSGLTPADINHVNAHATSTPAGDTTEAHSIRALFGEDTDHVIVTGTKSMTGHLLGAAGALETMATVLALHDRVVPPTINLDDPEDDLRVTIAANTAAELPAEGRLAALNNSFGFGGHNVALAITNDHVSR